MALLQRLSNLCHRNDFQRNQAPHRGTDFDNALGMVRFDRRFLMVEFPEADREERDEDPNKSPETPPDEPRPPRVEDPPPQAPRGPYVVAQQDGSPA